MSITALFTKQELIDEIADYRVENTPHKDRDAHVRALSKMSKRELFLISMRIMDKMIDAGWTPEI